MSQAIQRHKVGDAIVIPIALRPCTWKGTPFEPLQGLPRDLKPVDQWPDPNLAFQEIAEVIHEKLSSITSEALEDGEEKNKPKEMSPPSDEAQHNVPKATETERVLLGRQKAKHIDSQLMTAEASVEPVVSNTSLGEMKSLDYTPRSDQIEKSENAPQMGLSEDSIPDRFNRLDTALYVAALAKAIPMKGLIRIVYTCRSRYDDPKFKCPSDNAYATLSKSKTIPIHIPVDEIETLAFILGTYGSSICNGKEYEIKSSFVCSDWFNKKINGVIKNKEIDQCLLDNIIFLGENDGSNNFIEKFIEKLYFRHERKRDRKRIEIQFFEDKFNIPDPQDYNSILASNSIWATMTCIANPFEATKRILFLTGKHRDGQMMLLDWLRSESSLEVLENIATRSETENNEIIQIIIVGNRLNKEVWSSGMLQRQWRCNELKNASPVHDAALSYFYTPTLNHKQVHLGGDIADLSLIANIDNNCDVLKNIRNTLPEDVKNLSYSENTHVTCYEFMHRDGDKYHSILDLIMNNNIDFVEKMSEYFEPLPSFEILVRQARITKFSLQVIVDLSFPSNFTIDSLREHVSSSYRDKIYYMSALDVVAVICDNLSLNQREDIQASFNINASPKPLHITVARFDEDVSSHQKNVASEWVDYHKKTVWGHISNLPLSLVF